MIFGFPKNKELDLDWFSKTEKKTKWGHMRKSLK